MSIPDMSILPAARRMVGKTVEFIETEDAHERTEALVIRFTDGSAVKLDYFAEYADDAGLLLEWHEKKGTDLD